MNITEKSIIGEIVAENYRFANVFKQAGIDFCCQGNRTISDACESKGIESESLVKELENISQSAQSTQEIDYQSWPLDLLADYIEKKHHRYVVEKSAEILPYLNKIVSVHGSRHPELYDVQKQFKESVGELTSHMKKEEMILFPFVRKMMQTNPSTTPAVAGFGTVQNPIAVMMQEHEVEGDRFRKIAELTNNYTPPVDACNTYIVTFALLKEFEEELHLHIHLENNILFPKAVELEESLVS